LARIGGMNWALWTESPGPNSREFISSFGLVCDGYAQSIGVSANDTCAVFICQNAAINRVIHGLAAFSDSVADQGAICWDVASKCTRFIKGDDILQIVFALGFSQTPVGINQRAAAINGNCIGCAGCAGGADAAFCICRWTWCNGAKIQSNSRDGAQDPWTLPETFIVPVALPAWATWADVNVAKRSGAASFIAYVIVVSSINVCFNWSLGRKLGDFAAQVSSQIQTNGKFACCISQLDNRLKLSFKNI